MIYDRCFDLLNFHIHYSAVQAQLLCGCSACRRFVRAPAAAAARLDRARHLLLCCCACACACARPAHHCAQKPLASTGFQQRPMTSLPWRLNRTTVLLWVTNSSLFPIAAFSECLQFQSVSLAMVRFVV